MIHLKAHCAIVYYIPIIF